MHHVIFRLLRLASEGLGQPSEMAECMSTEKGRQSAMKTCRRGRRGNLGLLFRGNTLAILMDIIRLVSACLDIYIS